ncbi:MAG: hypothetical protein ABIJ47_11130 [Candidatus Bathyarchaeota archaeon]
MSRIIVGEFLMVGDLSSEVVHCPNCKEDVPKTLYCLNCGYPLYKIEQKKADMVEPEPETLEVVAPEEEVDMGVEIEQPGEPVVVEEEPAPVAEETMEEVTIEVEEAEEDVVEEPEAMEEPITAEPVEETEYVFDEETQADMVEEPEEPAEETVFEEPEEELIPEPEEEPILELEEEPIPELEEEILPEPEEEIILEPEEEAVPEPEEPMPEPIEEPAPEPAPEPFTITMEPDEMEEIRVEFAPDPLTKEVMDNLAKNITLKIRLVKLLRDNRVKEETFKKLFDSYVEQGKIWVSRRDEIIKRFKADIDRMENALVTARKDHELLEIRKSIGDAAEEEYTVKAPAYKWDIEHLEKEIKNRKGGIVYVVNLKKLVPEEEIAELEGMAETEYSGLDAIEDVSQDTIAKMKETLSEALSSLQA